MSNDVFPTLPGLTFDFHRLPTHKTQIEESVSGAEYRGLQMLTPRYTYKATYEFLRDQRQGQDELRTLLGFFNSHHGSFDSWLFVDPDDFAVTNQLFGTGDASTLAFQLVRTLGGFAEPVYAPASAAISRRDWQGNQMLYPAARTNYVWPSNNLASGNWNTTTGATLAAGSNLAPDGSSSAGTLSYSGSGTVGNYRAYITPTGALATPALGQSATVSIWVRAASTVTLRLWANLGVPVPMNVTTSWQRFSVTVVGDGSTGLQLLVMSDVASNAAFTVQMWGAQAENNVAPGSYIPTTTAPVSVTDYTLDGAGLVTLAAAPRVAATLTWTGTFYWRCRFVLDQLEFAKFAWRLWNLQTCDFVTLKPPF